MKTPPIKTPSQGLIDCEVESKPYNWSQNPKRPVIFTETVYIHEDSCIEISAGYIFNDGLDVKDCPNLRAIKAKINGDLKVSGCPNLDQITSKKFDTLKLGPLVGLKKLTNIKITNKHKKEVGLWIMDMPNLQKITGIINGTAIIDHCAVQNLDGIHIKSHWKNRPAIEVANCPLLTKKIRGVHHTKSLGQKVLDKPTPEEKKTKRLHFDLVAWQTFAKNIEMDPLWCQKLNKRTIITGGLEIPKNIKALSPWLIFTMNMGKGADIYLNNQKITSKIGADFANCNDIAEILGTYRSSLQIVSCAKLKYINSRVASMISICGLRINNCPKLKEINQKEFRNSISISGPTVLKELTGLRVLGNENTAGGIRFQNCPNIEKIEGYFTESAVVAGSGIKTLKGLRFPTPLTYCGHLTTEKVYIKTSVDPLPPNLPIDCIPISWKPEDISGATPNMVENWQQRKKKRRTIKNCRTPG